MPDLVLDGEDSAVKFYCSDGQIKLDVFSLPK